MASSTSTFSITGSCLCKTVQFSIDAKPVTRYLCHCLTCKKSSGSVFMHNWGFAQDAVTYTTGANHIKTYSDSNTKRGTPLERSFCTNCGSPVAIHTAIQPNRVFIPAGVFDDKALQNQVPGTESFAEERVAWMREVSGAKQIYGSKNKE